MKPFLSTALLIALFAAGCDQKSDKPASSANTTPASTTPENAAAGYLGALGKGQQKAISTVDTTSVDKAIQLFAVENGRNPKDLDELVQGKYIPKIPDAPYGTKLVYDAISGTVKVVKQ